jgi:hypothetical protein
MAEGLKGLRIYWLRRALRRNLISEPRYEDLMGRVAELGPQLNAYIRTLGRKAKEGPVKT